MPDRPLKLHLLRAILRRYDVWEDPSRGKGSHTMFFRRVAGSVFSYPIPTHGDEVQRQYVRGCRKRFQLTEEYGVSDQEFYG